MKAWSEKELSAMSDAQLLQCYLDGTNCCFTKFVSRHHAHVHLVAHYFLRNPEWEKDAEQETFIAFALEIRNGTYHETGHLSQYLNAIVRTQSLIILRREKRYVHSSTAFGDDVQQTETEEEIFKEHSSDTALLRYAMKRLTPKHRLAIELRDRDELSFKDIALQMNISEVTARTTYLKAKRHLKKIIEHILAQRRAGQQRRHH